MRFRPVSTTPFLITGYFPIFNRSAKVLQGFVGVDVDGRDRTKNNRGGRAARR